MFPCRAMRNRAPCVQLLAPRRGGIAVEVRDFEFTAVRWSDLASITYNAIIVEIESCYGPVRRGAFRFFNDASRPPVFIERHHSVSLGVAHLIGKYRCASIARTRTRKHFRQPVAKNILSPSTRETALSPMKSAPIRNACASPSGFGCVA